MTLAAAELLRYGVTTSVEMYFHDDLLAEAVDAAGSRCLVAPGIVVAPGWERFGSWADRIEWTLRLRDRYADHPRIEVGFGPHSAYVLPDEALVAIGEAARAAGAPVTVHLAETEHEGDEVSARHGGATVAQVLADLGVFDVDRVLAAHGVWLTRKDVTLLARPRGRGRALPEQQRQARLRYGRGAGAAPGRRPGRARHRRAGQQQRPRPLGGDAAGRALRPDAGAGPDRAAGGRGADLATAGGAAALGRPDLGVLAPGRWADIVRLDLDRPGLRPGAVRRRPGRARGVVGVRGPRSGTSGSAAGRWSGTASASRSTWPRPAAGCRPRRPGWLG